jgi:hypothetical protein
MSNVKEHKQKNANSLVARMVEAIRGFFAPQGAMVPAFA